MNGYMSKGEYSDLEVLAPFCENVFFIYVQSCLSKASWTREANTFLLEWSPFKIKQPIPFSLNCSEIIFFKM